MTIAHNLGFPRIGAHRETKQAVEAYWKGDLNQQALKTRGEQLRAATWNLQAKAGLNLLPVGDFSWYDHMLDMSVLLGVVPPRFGAIKGNVDLDTYFRMARGRAPTGADIHACEMTKWFDTNYHYIVPEFQPNQNFAISCDKLFTEIAEAQKLGFNAKPVIVGPLTYLMLGKTKQNDFDKLALLPKLIPVYQEILARLHAQGVIWVQIDEPILVMDLPAVWQQAFRTTYQQLQASPLKILLATYFGELEDNLALACELPTAGLHIDAVRGVKQIEQVVAKLPHDKILSVGIVDGRNIWRTDLRKALTLLKPLQEKLGERLWVAGASSLLHSPVDLASETTLDAELKNWLAFAAQKVTEIALLATALQKGEQAIATELQQSDAAVKSRQNSTRIHNPQVKERCNKVTAAFTQRASEFVDRQQTQQALLKLPAFPTTSIGSFPQTPTIRGLRRDLKSSKITAQSYQEQIRAEIADVIKKQELLDIDVLVHGEAERNDMVEYFGELLNGFAFTANGWVQSYGSRCVKPPIIFGDVSRSQPMTIDWISYAQSLTTRPVKGMLTGPITILCWSFVRDDQPRFATAEQIALALRDEVTDLEKAGINVIQIDEPAFREGLPLRQKYWQDYLQQAVESFRLASCGVSDHVQIHTHMCYSEFNDIIAAIADLDADVITIETSRSDMELLKAFEDFNYPNQIGPGVYDIHSPRQPTVEEIVNLIDKAANFIPIERLWVNPDCGLKTRAWSETETALQNMVTAAKALRKKHEPNKAQV